jgi:Domain of unknown function (DUF4157)
MSAFRRVLIGRRGAELEGRKKRPEATSQRSALNTPARGLPPVMHEVLRSVGQPLDNATRMFMEPRFGHHFSDVRVHTDAQAGESARQLNALAYTVGRDVVFAPEEYAPHTASGRRLLAHELAHTIQQSANGNRGWGELALGDSTAEAEREADTVGARVMAGVPARVALTSSGLAVQRQTPGSDKEEKPAEKKDAGEVVTEGLKTVAEQASDNNPQVKKLVIDPIKKQLTGQWDRLGPGEEATGIGFGAATLGLTGGALLSDPGGRKQLEGVNLAVPLTLIPYMPFTGFKYTLPSGDSPDKRLFRFETSFNADDLINLRTEARGLPKMSLSANLQWGYDPTTDNLRVLGGDASFGIVPGLSLSAGAYKDILRGPQMVPGPEGQVTQIKKSVPEFDKPQPIPDVRIMLNVDLMKFKPKELARQLKGLF